jgi:S-DNA-T family DNA segregation ATPase FtsK/SpoIIIE
MDYNSGAGGVIGHVWSGFLAQSVGFAGSTIILIAMIVIGSSLFFGFSWMTVAEKVGAALEWVMLKFSTIRTARQDRRAGQVAQAVRHEQVEAKHEKTVHEQPIRIEPAIVQVQKSERLQREKQQTLFIEPVAPGDHTEAREVVALAHGGAVDAQSVMGKGSRFTIRLPLADAGKSLLPEAP